MIIEINKLEDALNKYNKQKLDNNLEDFIFNEFSKNTNKIKTITIKSNLTNEDKELIKNTILKHYKNLVQELNRIDKYDDYIRLLLLFIGIVLISISEETFLFFSELFLITGWVFIWEMLYDGLFNQVKRKRKVYIYKKIINCNIEFIN